MISQTLRGTRDFRESRLSTRNFSRPPPRNSGSARARAHDFPQLVSTGLARADLFESPTGQLFRPARACHRRCSDRIAPKIADCFKSIYNRGEEVIAVVEIRARSRNASSGRRRTSYERTVSSAAVGRSVAHSVVQCVRMLLSPGRFPLGDLPQVTDGLTTHSLTHSLTIRKCKVSREVS